MPLLLIVIGLYLMGKIALAATIALWGGILGIFFVMVAALIAASK